MGKKLNDPYISENVKKNFGKNYENWEWVVIFDLLINSYKHTDMIVLLLIVLLVVGLFLFKRFLDKFGKFLPSTLLIMFLKKVKDMEDSGSGDIVISELGDYKVITLVEDGKVVDAISVDMIDDRIYAGVVKDNKPSRGDLLLPITLPFGRIDEGLSKLEDVLVDEVMEILAKYKN